MATDAAIGELSDEEKRQLEEYRKSVAAENKSAEVLNRAESGIAVVNTEQKIKMPEIKVPASKKSKRD